MVFRSDTTNPESFLTRALGHSADQGQTFWIPASDWENELPHLGADLLLLVPKLQLGNEGKRS
jgi:hypothetical protein